MTRPSRTIPIRPSVSGRAGWPDIADLRNALIDAAPACETADADLFTGPDAFTEEPEPIRLAREAQAKAVCAGCPARPECLAYALAIHPAEGVWAGLTSSEVLSLAAAIRREVA